MSNKSHSQTGTIVSSIASILILILTGWVILNRQYVFDQWSVWQYQPSSLIATIAARSGMSDKGQFYFYTSHPAVESATDFNTNCQRQEAKSAILGCYSGGRIYIYNISNSQLDGIEEVSAAHETLHVIWQRMSDSDKKSVGALLEAEYVKLNDPALKERMAYYDRQEPGEHSNELHSIIGTEITTINPELEAHYKTYFSDRSKILALYNGYEILFSTQKARVAVLDNELSALKTELESSVQSYNNEAASIESDYAALKSKAGSVDRTSALQVNSYNSAVSVLQSRVNKLLSLRATIIAKQDIYDAKAAEHNTLVVNTNELIKSLDSMLVSAPSL